MCHTHEINKIKLSVFHADDPLSAVDAHVGVHLFEKGICGALKRKTVILVTHQVHLLEKCDNIIVLKNGSVQSQGSAEEIRKAGIDVNEIVVKPDDLEPIDGSPRSRARTLSAISDVPETGPLASSRKVVDDFVRSADVDGMRSRSNSLTDEAIAIFAHTQGIDASNERAVDAIVRTNEDIIELFKSDSAKSIVASVVGDSGNRIDNNQKSDVLMTIEERNIGDVPLEVYMWYAKLGGRVSAAIAFIISVIGSAAFTYSSFWLADWGEATTKSYVEDNEPLSTSENNYYLNIYAAFCCIAVVGSCSRTTVLVFFGVKASQKMHNLLLDGILRSPVAFFDSTPLGRILNRFTSDVTNTDESLATNISFTLAMQAAILASIGAICYSTKGVLIILFVPLTIAFYKIQFFFRKSNTELKRLDNISRSPIYAQFDQALVGVTSLRAFDGIELFLRRFETSVDLNSSVIVLQQLIKWWISIRLEIIGGLVSCVIAALAVGWDGFLSDKYLSMSLNFSFALVSNMKWLVSISAEVEANMSSVERIKYYSDNLAVEEPVSVLKKYKPVHPEWPQEGHIAAKNIKMSYRTGPLVLKGIDFEVTSCEKIGIAGRTGCGIDFCLDISYIFLFFKFLFFRKIIVNGCAVPY